MSTPRLVPIGHRPGLPAYLHATAARVPFLREFVAARVHAEHAGSLLGPVWLLVTPLLNACLYFVVFGMLLGARHHVENYPLFLLTGVLTYAFFSRTVAAASKALRKQRDFVRTIPFPRILVPLAEIGIETRHLIWSLGVLIVVSAVTTGVHLAWLATAAGLGLFILLTTGIALMLARATARVPDTSGILPFAVRAGGYLSGVYFPLAAVTGNVPCLATVLAWNPIAVALTVARDGFAGTWPSPSAWAVLAGSALVALVAGVVVFWRGEPGYGRG